MEAIVTTPNIVSPTSSVVLSALRAAYVEGEGALKIKAKAYAQGLLDELGTAWLTMAHDEKGAAGDAMRAERDALYEGLRKAGHTNPSVKWKQIKDHAREILDTKAREEAIAAGFTPVEEESEGSGKANHARSLQLRLVEDLTTLYKACKKAKAKTNEQTQAMTHIVSALNALGVDISKV